MRCHHWLAALFIACLSPAIAEPQKPLQKIEHCTLVPTDWADGDSFQIKTTTGALCTIRLYGVDCLEWHISDTADADRLRAQRQYFGIAGVASTAQASIALAKNFGQTAAEKTRALLARPFTIHTRFRDALGDGKHPRIYAFVECSDGSDLAAELVKCGLARAYGVYADGPGERISKEYEKTLDDLERQAAKRGLGVWAKTDWDKLPAERQAQRKDESEVNLAKGKSALPADFKVNPNKAARDDLMNLPGIGEEMANRIIEHRPYKKAGDLLMVPGIAEKKLEKIQPHLDFQKP